MSKSSLVEISSENYSALRDKFAVDWPRHIASFTHFNTLVKRQEKNKHQNRKNENAKVLSLNGDWRDGTFIAMVKIYNSEKSSTPNFLKSFRMKEMFSLELWIQL